MKIKSLSRGAFLIGEVIGICFEELLGFGDGVRKRHHSGWEKHYVKGVEEAEQVQESEEGS